jgi:DUF1680 family protein
MPLQPDGHAFYYSDYHSSPTADAASDSAKGALGAAGKRVYSTHRWPCCSGTLPQVVADYWINGYFHEPGAVWVNLYLASVLLWNEGETKVEMELEGTYPETPQVRLRMKTSHPISFALKLRIPAWAEGASLAVNGKSVKLVVVAGFATVRRKWRAGDTVELQLPMKPRFEALDEAHPETVGVLFGPRVLFALASELVVASKAHVLEIQQAGSGEWTLQSANGPVKMVPFTSVGDEAYLTYIQMAG